MFVINESWNLEKRHFLIKFLSEYYLPVILTIDFFILLALLVNVPKKDGINSKRSLLKIIYYADIKSNFAKMISKVNIIQPWLCIDEI